MQQVGSLHAGLHRRATSASERPDHLHTAVPTLGYARRLTGQDRAGCGLGVFGIALAGALEVATLGPLNLHHWEPRVFEVASEIGTVAAGPFHSGTPHGAKSFRPREEATVASGGRRHLQLSQGSAQS